MNPLAGMHIPRLPLDGRLDLTYRCNNACCHCWLRLPADSPAADEELSSDEIRRIVNEARRMGCQAWYLSGGEPMLRPDFPEIFDFVTRTCVSYTLNTNGSLITPEIARLLTRRGRKLVALYGATAEVHDEVTGRPGSFEATMRGFAYLREAGAAAIVQIIPMRANYHQYDAMAALALSLSSHYRVGAPWLWFSACRSESRNREIALQRLDPGVVITLDPPDPLAGEDARHKEDAEMAAGAAHCPAGADDRLFASCVASRGDFHVDPYGRMSLCYFVVDSALRYDLRQGTFQEAWDKFIPSLANAVHGGREYRENCGSCALRTYCRWCPVYGYLEHGRYSAKVEYLCEVAKENASFKTEWRRAHVRYYQIAGVTLRIARDVPIAEDTFSCKFDRFQVDGPGADTISLRLVSGVPPLSDLRLGQEVCRRPPWIVYRQSGSWVYLSHPTEDGRDPYFFALFDADYRSGTICLDPRVFAIRRLESLTGFPSDQMLIAPIMADRQACYLHASGIVLDGKGLLFVGHSEAGKSTMMKLLKHYGEVLCDESIIVRRWPEGFRIHGTWSHGELPDVCSDEAPLHAVFFLEKANENALIALPDTADRLARTLAHIVKPLQTADWWEKTLDLAGRIASEVPAYRLRFDLSGRVVDLLRQM